MVMGEGEEELYIQRAPVRAELIRQPEPGTQLGEMFANGPVMAATAADAVAKKENAP
jgi:hypothetical protein